TQWVRCRVALVFSGHPAVTLKSDPTESTVGAAVHGLRGECAGEHAAHEDEILILAWPAHPVVPGRPADYDNLPAALIGADQVPALVPHSCVFFQLGWARQVSA